MASAATMNTDTTPSYHASTNPMEKDALPGQAPESQGPKATVSINRLRPLPQWIECPKCHKTAQTSVKGRSDGKKKFMNIFWWPLPGRENWWETLHWFCTECNEEVATQKNGKEVRPTA